MTSNAAILRQYFWQPLHTALSYSASSTNSIKHLARSEEISAEAAYALMSAARFFAIERPDMWMDRFRAMRFVDRLDLYLTLLNSDRWLDRWVLVEGRWPQATPFVGITFHYGAGFWAFRHLQAHGHKLTMLRRKIQRAEFGGEWARYRYNALRNWNMDRVTNSPAAVAEEFSARDALAGLESGRCFFGVIDVVPPREKRNCVELPFLGRVGRFDPGLIRLAKMAGVPVVVYTMSVNEDNVTRTLRISEPISSQDLSTAGFRVFSELEKALVRDSTQWHQWGVVNSFFPEARGPLQPHNPVRMLREIDKSSTVMELT